MRDAASQLTDKVEFLGMLKHCFRLAAIGNLVAEAPVGLGELARSLDDQLLETAIDGRASCSAFRMRSSACTVAINSSSSIGSTR